MGLLAALPAVVLAGIPHAALLLAAVTIPIAAVALGGAHALLALAMLRVLAVLTLAIAAALLVGSLLAALRLLAAPLLLGGPVLRRVTLAAGGAPVTLLLGLGALAHGLVGARGLRCVRVPAGDAGVLGRPLRGLVGGRLLRLGASSLGNGAA